MRKIVLILAGFGVASAAAAIAAASTTGGLPNIGQPKGKLTEKDAHIVLNAPVLKVGQGG